MFTQQQLKSFLRVIYLFLLLGISNPLFAQWSTDPNINTAICTATGSQGSPTIVSDGAGGAIITWSGYPSAYSAWSDIYAQRINASGVVQWTTNGVSICAAAYLQSSSGIVSDGAGGAIITWQDGRSGLGSNDIYAQRINASGIVQWTADGVAICTAAENQYDPAIVSDGAGWAIITWQDLRSGNADIYAQRINASGVVQWTTNGVAICTAADNQYNPTLVSDGAGGSIIAWEDDYRDIHAQRINASGVVQWTANGVAICTMADPQYYFDLVSDDAGGAIITWQDERSAINKDDIYAQRINASGVVQWTTDGVAIGTARNDQLAPTIARDGSGGAIITWYDAVSGSFDIYAQRINVSGVVQWAADGVVICTALSGQYNPTLVSDGVGGAIISWVDYRSGARSDIYAQRINASGVVRWDPNGVAICTAAANQFFPILVSNGAEGAIITWKDERNGGNPDTYAQQVSASGTLGGGTGVNEDQYSQPTRFTLAQNYPNPFNPSTVIQYSIPKASHVELIVFDLLGRELQVLVNEKQQAGIYQVQFDGQNLPAGLYYYRLRAGEFCETKKMLIVK